VISNRILLLTYATYNPLISWGRRNVANLTLCATKAWTTTPFGLFYHDLLNIGNVTLKKISCGVRHPRSACLLPPNHHQLTQHERTATLTAKPNKG
jgi:hypothetical protein